MPVAKKTDGSTVGFIGKTTTGERWLLKLGMDNSHGKKVARNSALYRSMSVARKAVATDAIYEVVAAAAFKVR